MERAVAPRPPGWAWLLVGLGFVLAIGLAAHAATQYVAIDRINQASHIDTLNPVLLFQELATNGPRVSANVDSTPTNSARRASTSATSVSTTPSSAAAASSRSTPRRFSAVSARKPRPRSRIASTRTSQSADASSLIALSACSASMTARSRPCSRSW